jgi:capsid protein
MQQAVLAGAVAGVGVAEYAASPQKFESVRFRPRGWGWVDPTKEVAAYKDALKAGFTTRADIIAATGAGLDIEEVDAQREKELDDQEARDLVYDTDPDVYVAEAAGPPTAAPPAAEESEPEDEPEDDEQEPEPAARVVSLRR